MTVLISIWRDGKLSNLIIIVDGPGGIGKDTFIELCSKHLIVENVSSIDPIKKIAFEAGWDGEKNPKSRKMLADLKTVFTEFNDLPNTYIIQCISDFMQVDDGRILFVHIREPENIKLISDYCDSNQFTCVTLLVTGDYKKIGNRADDDFSYPYDYTFFNHKNEGVDSLSIMEQRVMELMKTIIEEM